MTKELEIALLNYRIRRIKNAGCYVKNGGVLRKLNRKLRKLEGE